MTFPGAGAPESPASSTNAAILASAESQLGAGQDCTVLGEQALKAAGVGGVGDESPAGLMESATPVAVPHPGDFIYYEDGGAGVPHNAVYIGGGEAIHSGFNGGQTVVNSADIGSGPSYYRVNA
ncbi:NlpC/P60 family protein [Arthrobacter sp. MDT1-65]